MDDELQRWAILGTDSDVHLFARSITGHIHQNATHFYGSLVTDAQLDTKKVAEYFGSRISKGP
ncbi:hypothetical protein Herbaro_05895 [Herbaspirillum sp. WKF16]|uniref:hypothetical protein n=1 Tax=Herbaspirillum sp. WKF16 TaxID=3028312 RepID=UPI0023AA018F|nr:hypothetical protein [Herbaspirillum sp. WKF16]WDZ97319.1 hypothetical protein Herbaro_05895 [Herbaspirillum sp. WKF16]